LDLLDSFCTDQMKIATRKAWMWVALEGEMVQKPTPLEIKALAGALKLVSP
jgi:hypothetical protein